MQAQEGAAAMVMEQPAMDTEAMTTAAVSGDALLPVLLPNVGGEVTNDGAEELRRLLPGCDVSVRTADLTIPPPVPVRKP
jgi:hypothetical protein